MSNILIMGAGGHAIEVLDIILQLEITELTFFNNLSPKEYLIFDHYKVITKISEQNSFKSFLLGLGGIKQRIFLSDLAQKCKLQWNGVRSLSSSVSKLNVSIDQTVDIMNNVQISPNVSIGRGTLINRSANIHHDVKIGLYCEIAPNAIILGRADIGNEVFIGAGAIILPDIHVSDNSIIGAGAVVTKNVGRGEIVLGNPAKIKTYE